jgi:hypothetical protein
MRLKRNTIALGAIFLTLPLFGMAQSNSNSNSMAPANPEARSQAAQMVSASATLLHNLDTKDLQPNAEVRAKLNSTVKLENGTKLASGTVLVGHVVQDQAEPKGQTTRIAFDFNQAQLKDGKTVPIKATIVGMTPDANQDVGYLVQPGDKWTDGPLQIDQVGVLSGVDLHSRIAGENSGVLVSTKSDDLRLRQGSGIQFAIGPASAGQQASS